MRVPWIIKWHCSPAQIYINKPLPCLIHPRATQSRNVRRYRRRHCPVPATSSRLATRAPLLVVRGNDKVRVGGAAVVDVVDAGDLGRLVHAQAARTVQRPEQRQAARGMEIALQRSCNLLWDLEPRAAWSPRRRPARFSAPNSAGLYAKRWPASHPAAAGFPK